MSEKESQFPWFNSGLFSNQGKPPQAGVFLPRLVILVGMLPIIGQDISFRYWCIFFVASTGLTGFTDLVVLHQVKVVHVRRIGLL